MNHLTLGLIAAALTVVIVKVMRRGRSRQLTLPMDATYGVTATAPAPAPPQSSSGERTGSSDRNVGLAVQAALRNYGNKQLAFRGADGTGSDSFMSSRAVNDGIIGPITRQIWDQVRGNYNAVLARRFGWLMDSGPAIESLEYYQNRGASGTANLLAVINRLNVAVEKPAYWTVINSL